MCFSSVILDMMHTVKMADQEEEVDPIAEQEAINKDEEEENGENEEEEDEEEEGDEEEEDMYVWWLVRLLSVGRFCRVGTHLLFI